MTTPRCSVKNTPARWLSLLAATMTLPAAAAPPGPAELARAYRESPGPAKRAPLERYAESHAKDAAGALARLALAVTAFEQKDYAEAEREARAAGARLPKLADYVAYYLAAARIEAKDAGVTAADLAAVRAPDLASPLAANATVLEARALAARHAGAEAVRLLTARYADLPQPEGDLALAAAHEATRDLAQAAAVYQRVYYGYPFSEAATRAAAALLALKEAMGSAYPLPSGALLLGRADKLLAGREYVRAKAEYRELLTQLGGTERDHARVRMGAADYRAGDVSAAYRYLRALTPAAPGADAERLYYLAECARRLGDDDELTEAVRRLSSSHPKSPWRFKALVTAGNRFLLENQPDKYVPLFKAAYEGFPAEPQAPYCHWKVAWHSYLNRKGDARERLRRHVEEFPFHTSATAALYFLGRLAERQRDFSEAGAYYEMLQERFPNYYYGLLARERLGQQQFAGGAAAATSAYLRGLGFPPAPRGVSGTSAATALRIERARLLRSAGLDDLAETELRFGAKAGEQGPLLALELARGGDLPHEKLRLMKSMRIDYFALPVDGAPAAYWETLFPLPYRNDVVRNARQHELDPFTVAALIRQESEFNPQALSRARAYGLTQVMPSTGRLLARRVGIRRFSNRMLFQPAVNLKLGTYYMRSLLDKWGGRWEETLASYNAGPNRVSEWSGWRSYEEPAEFIESIPFTETREYVQAVLRNAAMYRRIYEDRPLKVPGTKVAGKKPPAKNGGTVASAKKRPRAAAGR